MTSLSRSIAAPHNIDEDICARMRVWRRDLHAHPETAFQEHRTARLVATTLEAIGLNVHLGLAGTGVVAALRNGEGPTITLRADMDALDIQELSSLPYASTVPGKMHACGHDGHTAMLLGAAAQLARRPRFAGCVQFVFQPAEENEGGGRVMVEQGLFERFPCSAVYGMHNFPGLELGRFAIRSGCMTAFLDNFEIRIEGRGCHGATPELGIDPIVSAAQLINALQTIVSRNVAAAEAAVVSVTQIHGGDTWNVIPTQVSLRGTARSLDSGVRARIQTAMERICEGIARSQGTAVALDYRRGYPGVVNTARETAAATAAAAGLVGIANVDTDTPPLMAAEDFAFMLQHCPGAYIGIGTGRGPDTPPVHTPYYDFNDEALPLGAAYWVALTELELPLSR